MTSSGTTDFTLDMVEAIEESFERCGLESRNGYDAKTARRSINLMMQDWANRGLNLWTTAERSVALIPGVQDYIIEADVVDVLETMLQAPPNYQSNPDQLTRYNVTRASLPTFAAHTNPTLGGRPTQVYVDRQITPVLRLWPVPDSNQDGGFLIYWVLRRIQDAGAYTNTADLPFRFLPAFISGLAYMIAVKKRQDDPALIMRLKGDYAEDWQRAADEDREKATLRSVPKADSYRVGRSR